MKKVALVMDRNRIWEIYETELKKHGFAVDLFDIWKMEEQKRLLTGSYDAFIWRAKHNPKVKNLARRFLYLFDQQYRIPTFPDWNSYWHFDDKIAQSFLFDSFQIPTAKTYIFFDEKDALAFTDKSDFPVIYKCAHGAGSSNVGILNHKKEARRYIKKVFGRGVPTFFKSEVQRGYVYLQEFLKDNTGDYRLVCYGNSRIHGFFRENRQDSVFASGSGKFMVLDLPEDLLDFVASVNEKLKYPLMSYDVLKDNNGQWVITEISVIFGDLSTQHIYDQTPVYIRENGNWVKGEMTENMSERVIRYLLKKVWKWV